MAIALNARLKQLAERVDALELRERALLLVTAVVSIFLIVDTLGLQPALKAQQVQKEEASELEMKLGALQVEANLLSIRSDEDPVQAQLRKRDELNAQLAGVNERILAELGALVEPAEATELLKQVLADHEGLNLGSLRARASALDAHAATGAGGTGLGRYQLELALHGGYLDLLRYLEALEALPWKFFWNRIDFQVDNHPQAVTHLQIYTLGAHDG